MKVVISISIVCFVCNFSSSYHNNYLVDQDGIRAPLRTGYAERLIPDDDDRMIGSFYNSRR